MRDQHQVPWIIWKARHAISSAFWRDGFLSAYGAIQASISA